MKLPRNQHAAAFRYPNDFDAPEWIFHCPLCDGSHIIDVPSRPDLDALIVKPPCRPPGTPFRIHLTLCGEWTVGRRMMQIYIRNLALHERACRRNGHTISGEELGG